MMNLRILIRAGYPGLSRLVLNVIKGILHKREGGGRFDNAQRRRGLRSKNTESDLKVLALKTGELWPQG